MLSPKEKAQELYAKYYQIVADGSAPEYHAKQCAIIAVEEIINSAPTIGNGNVGYTETLQDLIDEHIEYYKEVIKEIEKL